MREEGVLFYGCVYSIVYEWEIRIVSKSSMSYGHILNHVMVVTFVTTHTIKLTKFVISTYFSFIWFW